MLSTISEGNNRENIANRGKPGASRVTRSTLANIGNVGTSIHEGKVHVLLSNSFTSIFLAHFYVKIYLLGGHSYSKGAKHPHKTATAQIKSHIVTHFTVRV